MGVPLTLMERVDHDYAINGASMELGVAAFEDAWATGYATPFEETVAATVGEEGYYMRRGGRL
jgi:hypothetical protein